MSISHDDSGTRIRAAKVRPFLIYPDIPNVIRTDIYGSGIYVHLHDAQRFAFAFRD